MEEDDKFTRITLRIPKDVHAKISAAVHGKATSQNAEIVRRLEDSFKNERVNVSEETLITIGILAMAIKQFSESIAPETLPEEKRRFVSLLEHAAIQVLEKLPKRGDS